MRSFIRRQAPTGFDDKPEIQGVGFGGSKQTFD